MPPVPPQGVLAAIYSRLRQPPLAVTVFMALHSALVTVRIVWRRHCRSAGGGSYARWGEAITVLMLLNDTVVGAHKGVVRAWLEVVGTASGQGILATLRHAAILGLASRAPTNLLMWCMPVRLRCGRGAPTGVYLPSEVAVPAAGGLVMVVRCCCCCWCAGDGGGLL